MGRSDPRREQTSTTVFGEAVAPWTLEGDGVIESRGRTSSSQTVAASRGSSSSTATATSAHGRA